MTAPMTPEWKKSVTRWLDNAARLKEACINYRPTARQKKCSDEADLRGLHDEARWKVRAPLQTIPCEAGEDNQIKWLLLLALICAASQEWGATSSLTRARATYDDYLDCVFGGW